MADLAAHEQRVLLERVKKAVEASAMVRRLAVPPELCNEIAQLAGVPLIPVRFSMSALAKFKPRHSHRSAHTEKRWEEERGQLQRVVKNAGGMLTFQPQRACCGSKFAQHLETLMEPFCPLAHFGNFVPKWRELAPSEKSKKQKQKRKKHEWVDERLPTQETSAYGATRRFDTLYREALMHDKAAFEIDIFDLCETVPDTYCFEAEGLVLLADGSRKRVCELAVGDRVRHAAEVATVVACVRTDTPPGAAGFRTTTCAPGLWLTEGHPVWDEKQGRWLSAHRYSKANGMGAPVRRVPHVYNYVLDGGHVLDVNGVSCVTLGHGIREEGAWHPYWGTRAVVDVLRARPDWPNVTVVAREATMG